MQAWTRRSLLAALSGAMAGCGGGSEDESQSLAFERVVQAWMQTALQETYVLRTEVEWQRVWNLHLPPSFAPVPLPRVDFSRFMVVGLTLGTGPNGCYGLNILRVLATANQGVVEYRVSEPTPTSVCTLATVALTDFVVVSRLEGPVAFRRVSS